MNQRRSLPPFYSVAAMISLLLNQASCQTGLSSQDQQDLLNAHNHFRGIVDPTASNMETMVWNSELAQVAQMYAEQCTFYQNADRTSQQNTFTYVGENNFITNSRTVNYTSYVRIWFNQRDDYTYQSNSCSGVCGHYTQVVWATSNSLGCGAFRCSQTVGFSARDLLHLVCNYGPGGNFFGRLPYTNGTPCSDCSEGLNYCVSNLCSVCPPLQPPNNGMLLEYSSELATFQCNKGYVPGDIYTAICHESGMWSNDPANHNCTDINECADNPCPQDSPCFNTEGSYTCGCDVGYFYARSDVISLNACIDVDECLFGENGCSKKATCTNTIGSFTCECDPGYTGDGRQCIPIDEICLCVGLNDCVLGTSNSSRCACDRGYYLHLNGTCIDINECNVTAYNNTLCEHGTCENTEGSFTCRCLTGYMSDDNNNCIDIDECEVHKSCDVAATCENTIGSFMCECPTGYFGDGLECERGLKPIINTTYLQPTRPNINSEYNIGTSFCIEDPVNISVQFTVTCPLQQLGVPTPDLQFKILLEGADLDSNNSNVSIMISSTNYYGNETLNDTITIDGTIQIDSQSSLIITCMLSNQFGEDAESTSIRLCDINECQDGVTNNCTQECTRDLITGQHHCSCELGYELVGDTTCKDMNECAMGEDFHNCSLSNNQTCVNLPPPERYTCECITGYHSIDGGDTCVDIDECDIQTVTCSLYARCNNTIGSYTCECISGTEKNMDGTCKDVNECDPDKGPGFHNCSSSNNRECVNQLPPEQYSCKCMQGYQSPDGGDFCEDIDECSLSNYTCPSVTQCGNTIGSYTCTPSRGLIIAVTSSAGFIVVIVIITVLIIVCHNRLKKTVIAIFKRKPNRLEAVMINQINETPSISRRVKMRDSIRSKLPKTVIFKSADLKVKESIGQGEFGIVYKGYLTCHNNKELVAIKTLKGFIDDSAVEELLRECARMAAFDHPHVMTLIGVCLDGGPVPYLVLPYMTNGSLLTYLKKERHNLVIESEDEQLLDFTRKRLMDMCLQVAQGMEYLTTHKIVHRDLAARNCMIDMNKVIKVADFGLSVSTGSKLYFRAENAVDLKLPVMWMAPESLMDYIFSEQSDIWSYGVTCWEVFSGGQAPYAGVRPSKILKLLQNGERLDKTSNSACSQELYAMMSSCWEMEPDNRPNFSSIVNTLSESLEEMADYFSFGAFTELDDSV